MVSPATLAPVRASISTPVLALVRQVQRILTVVLLMGSILNLHFSIGRGWQKGMRSEVFLAAIVPAIIAVWNTGPFFDWISSDSSFCISSAPSSTRHSAMASRCVVFLSETSTIPGWFSWSICVNSCMSVLYLS